MLEKQILDALLRIEDFMRIIASDVEKRNRKEQDVLLKKIVNTSSTTRIRK